MRGVLSHPPLRSRSALGVSRLAIGASAYRSHHRAVARTTARRVGRYGILREIGRGYLDALAAAIFASYLAEDRGIGDVAQAARAAPPAPDLGRPMDVLLDGLAARFSEG
jgi:hypothetical protein